MKKIYLLSLLCAISFATFAQSPEVSRCEVFRPEVLGNKIIFEHEATALGRSNRYGQNIKPQNGVVYWEAYSDSENNTTYMEPSTSSTKCSELRFSQVVRIAKIDYATDMALVYSDPNRNMQYPQISGDAVWYGWIPMKRLLLWSGCLANKHGIFNKALICANYEVAKGQASSSHNGLDVGYRQPSKIGKKYDIQAGASRFFFIMKRENGMVLLATQSTMQGEISRELLYCWVEDKNYVPWNQRTCLEPNWDQEAVDYFIKNGVKTHSIYGRPDLSDFLASVKTPIKDVLPKDALYMSPDEWEDIFRWPGDKLRNPILDGTNANIWHLSTFTAPGGSLDVDPEAQKANAANKKVLENKQKINLVFVIDGTSSMQPYYPQVREAIKSSLEYFATEQQVKVGVVVYRNKADGNEGRLVEKCAPTERKLLARVTSFLNNVETRSVGLTEEEALYTGLSTALDDRNKFFPKGESNIMIVIGDCGEKIEGSDPYRAGILAKLVEKDVHLMAFQVQNYNKPAYTAFGRQMNWLIRNSMLGNYRKNIKVELHSKIGVKYSEIQDNGGKGVGYIYCATNNGKTVGSDEALYVGSSRTVDPAVGGKMPIEALQPLINETVLMFARSIQTQLDELLKRMQGIVGPAQSLVKSDGTVNLGDAFADKLLKVVGNRTVNFAGYTRKKHASGYDYFKPVLFIEDKELDELLLKLVKVKQEADKSNVEDRKSYIEALKALVANITGMSDKGVNGMTQQEIMNMIGGITVDTSSIKSYTLDELNNPNVVDNQTYKSIIDDFSKKYEVLQNIKASEDYRKRYAKDFNGECFYWIPIDLLP